MILIDQKLIGSKVIKQYKDWQWISVEPETICAITESDGKVLVYALTTDGTIHSYVFEYVKIQLKK